MELREKIARRMREIYGYSNDRPGAENWASGSEEMTQKWLRMADAALEEVEKSETPLAERLWALRREGTGMLEWEDLHKPDREAYERIAKAIEDGTI